MSQNSQPPEFTVKCPQCKKTTVYSASNPFRPFCSERCRLTDLGQWAEEKYRVPDENSSSISLNDSSANEED